MYPLDSTILWLIPAIIFSMIASSLVKSTFKKYSKIAASRGMTGSDVAQRILQRNGVNQVRIERVRGSMTDHFDPRSNVLRLSETVHSSNSIAALGVAAHEAGHAIQHNDGYAPIKVRNAIVPVVNFGSKLAFPLILIGLFANFGFLIYVGIVAYTGAVAFQLITLPVEFDASKRAIEVLEDGAYLTDEEMGGARKVLRAAAMTYVAAALAAVLQLLRLLSLARRRN